MNYILNSGLFAVVLMLAMMLMLEIGRRIALRRRAANPDGAHEGISALEGAIFGLMGLLFAFTFSGAASRFDARRQLIVQETNDIGTAYLRVDLLPTAVQPAMREHFRRYLDARLAAYRGSPTVSAAIAEHERSVKIQGGNLVAGDRGHPRQHPDADHHVAVAGAEPDVRHRHQPVDGE